MKRVYKYNIEICDSPLVTMPKGAEILTVGTQKNVGDDAFGRSVCIWALVDPDAETETREFRLAGTGHDIEGDLERYVGTIFLGDYLVFHLFERPIR